MNLMIQTVHFAFVAAHVHSVFKKALDLDFQIPLGAVYGPSYGFMQAEICLT